MKIHCTACRINAAGLVAGVCVVTILTTFATLLPTAQAQSAVSIGEYLWHFTGGARQGAGTRRSDNPPKVEGRRQDMIRPLAPDFYVDFLAISPLEVAYGGPSEYTSTYLPCRIETTRISVTLKLPTQIIERNDWRAFGYPYCPRDVIYDTGGTMPGPPPIRWTLEDKITFNTPVRRKALDGGEFDASPMMIERAGNPWITYYWGYKLGLVESQSDWNDANRSKMPSDWPVFPTAEDNFKLTTLPPPWVEGEVTEYVNTADFPRQPDGQYFYAATDEDRAALDAVPAWQRTGNRFKHGGYVSVCRFYGGKNGGPNTHFYSASDTECNWLKGFSFLSYEGQTFRVNLPLPLAANAPPGTQPSCPAGSIPLYRLYNNAGAPGKTYVSNHRYVTTRSAVDAAAAKGWLDEGTVMCVPQ